MTSEQIEKYAEQQQTAKPVNIHFKDRQAVSGLFIQVNDYRELKSKNLWRIVSNKNIEEWKRTGDLNLSRIFNGISFTKLSWE